jgi:hypothetical protein
MYVCTTVKSYGRHIISIASADMTEVSNIAAVFYNRLTMTNSLPKWLKSLLTYSLTHSLHGAGYYLKS